MGSNDDGRGGYGTQTRPWDRHFLPSRSDDGLFVKGDEDEGGLWLPDLPAQAWKAGVGGFVCQWSTAKVVGLPMASTASMRVSMAGW